MTIAYARELDVELADFIDIIKRSNLAEHRDTKDNALMEAMLAGADLWAVARDTAANGRIVGLARCVTDFVYVCFCSELAVDQAYVEKGVGEHLVKTVRAEIDDSCRFMMTPPEGAETFCESAGMERLPRAYAWPQTQSEAARVEV